MSNIFDFEEENPVIYDNISALKPQMPWLETLNPEQRTAVEQTEGPVLVLSGAGTGKTRVLTTRLAYILATMRAQPWNCLVMTFTNRAAKEMKIRAAEMIGSAADSVWLGTFHSICVKILRVHANLVGLESNFTILGEDDQKRLIKQIILSEGVDEKKYPPQAFVDKISRFKDKGLTVDKLGPDMRDNITTMVYKKYQARLLELNCVDFGDILLYTLEILLKNPEVLDRYQEKFRYVMVDEYQDTNVTQYLFLRLISQKYHNLCCVGDDDQSIYSWRGAEIENILRFEKDFPQARVIRLERNYRSTDNILKAASELISHNQGRLGKTLKVAENSPAQNCLNEKIKLISCYNGEEEAGYVVRTIEDLRRSGYLYSDMAILVRTAFQMREMEEKLIAEAVPYQVIGGPKFYERQEIRDLLAYFRVIVQPDDDLALERIINKPARGIGAKSIEKFESYARENHISVFEAVRRMLQEGLISGKAKNALVRLTEQFEEWQKLLQVLSPDDLASTVLEDSGYLEMLKNDQSVEAPGRIENLKELVSVMSDTQNYPTLSDFLEHVSLVMDNDSTIDSNKVMLMTLHSAKGLEFKVVFLPGWEEGLFPHQRSLDEGGTQSLEEERRLAYVAITRAKQKLYILTTISRRIYGQWQTNIPSRFLNEIPTPCLEICNNTGGFYRQSAASAGFHRTGSSWKQNTNADFAQTRYSKPKRQLEENSNSSAHEYSYEPDEQYMAQKPAKFMRVYHETFGYGTLLKIDGQKCLVSFDKFGQKNILGTYLRRA